MSIAITGTGCYIPKNRVKRSDFLNNKFVDKSGNPIKDPNEIIVEKFVQITGIEERRYADKDQVASDLAFLAAQKALKDWGGDPEELDYIIVAQNFGDVRYNQDQTDQVPALAARVKYKLRIKNPNCVTYDLIFGCPGWLEGFIHASAFIKAGMAKKCLVIGAEALSRVIDKHDRDCMIFADGAGAAVIEKTSQTEGGILAHKTASFTYSEAPYLNYDVSSDREDAKTGTRYVKMSGRRIYNFALKKVPAAMKACFDSTGRSIDELHKIFIHQANEKMDVAMVDRFYKLYNKPVPDGVMPMNIHTLGNTSVATLPTLFDMVRKGDIAQQSLKKGDLLIFASVGAGMNVNALVYQY